MHGKTRQNKIRNDIIKESVGVTLIVEKIGKIDLCDLGMYIEDL